MSFPTYDEYKASGVNWLGNIPAHWSLKPLKRCIERNDGGVWGSDPDDDEGDTVVLRSTEQTVDGEWRIEEPAKRKLTQDEVDSALLIEGDLLVTKSSGSALHIGKTTIVSSRIAELRCCYSNFMQRLRTSTSLIPKLAWYVLNNGLARRQFDFLANSTTGLANLNSTMIGQVLIPLAPLAEQSAIASFLDVETSKIDALVSEQRRLIALLKEKRQAVISHAVTKGLNPNAPMKPSGIPWLGEVPEHWRVGPLKRFWSVTDCKHVTAEFVDDGIPLSSIREVQSKWVDLDNAKKTTQKFYELLIEGDREPKVGDLIFSRNATVGEVAQVGEHTPKFAMGQDVCLFRKHNKKSSSDYWQHVLKSTAVVEQMSVAMVGATFKRINVDEIRNLSVAAPPCEEQNWIAAFIENRVGRLDQLQTEAERAIELLQERRAALISATVTGKIDVRGYAARKVVA
ncbi:restriction endonuclease subunit S [Roseimaritima sediminicola]|uniref:restriction endonuclease subunit S n=1 Tax=Roseimaritima sediminicola TaxID=2662066 RepID=UPI00129841BF|nr:restriction endonuclease subunit S [Roseimaritima sediminicola]